MAKALTDQEFDAFRDTLCEVATGLFAREGYAAVTLRRLAQEAGCSRQTPYRFFRNKDDIFAEVFLRCHRVFTGYCERAAAGTDDAREMLLRIRDAYLEFAHDEPDAYEVVFGMDPPIQFPRVAEQLEYSWSSLQALFAEAVRQGAVEGDPASLGYLFWTTLDGLARLQKAGPERVGLDLSTTAGAIEGLFFARQASRV
jgi:AcrR family transcriptional regulator